MSFKSAKGDIMAKTERDKSSMKTIRTFLKVGTCSEALCNVLDRAFEHPLKLEEHASMPLAGGILARGYQCGMVWGSTLAAGAEAYRLFGPGPEAEAAAIVAGQRIVDSFRDRNQDIDCLEITDTNWLKPGQMFRYFIKGGPIRCFRMAAKYAPIAFDEIKTALSGKHIEIPSPPVSCSALLAQKMGVSDLHRVMVAGFAGGIGLSGSGCGALGAAIWINEMNAGKSGKEKIEFKSPRAKAAIKRFKKCTDSKYRCSEIVGRKFDNVSDHADFLRDGGCSKIIDALAAE
jgi:hypothetical protein